MFRIISRLGVLVALLLFLGSLLPARHVAAQQWRVGIQAGHWLSHELPDELARLRTSTGTAAGGYKEYEVNVDMAYRTAYFLSQAGVIVDVLPATVPPSYQADAFVALHTDGSNSTRPSGYKAAAHWRDWEPSLALVEALREEYGAASGLAWDGSRITSNMRGYYALSSDRFVHAISNDTPGVILEMGFLTNAHDRRLMTEEGDRLAKGIADGILRFLASKPAEGWPAPPPLPEFRATVIVGVANIRSGPSTRAPVVRTARRGQILLVAEVQESWVRLVAYNSSGERWIHRNVVELTRIRDEQPHDH